MGTPIVSEIRTRTRYTTSFGALYTAFVLCGFHWAMVAYINSSVLEQYVSNTTIGLLYSLSALLTIGSFLYISKILSRVGNFRITLLLGSIELLLLAGLASSTGLFLVLSLFVLHQCVVPLILFNLDIYMEEMIGGEEATTGTRRGLLLGLTSVAGALGPLVSGYLVDAAGGSFTLAYSGSAVVMMLFLFVLFRYFAHTGGTTLSEIAYLRSVCVFWGRKNLRNVFGAHALLQLFFVWTVIYIPLYLTTQTAFTWEEIGLVLFVGLLAYVIFEYPIGFIADRWWGEKEMMLIGFVVLSVSVAGSAFLEGASLGAWMAIAFATRVGASLVETTTESYFFKQTGSADAQLISFFRITRPLSYLIGALLGSAALVYMSLNTLFLALGIVLFLGVAFAIQIKDTK
ncbi:MFS transporter [Candidatus Kaiserbacteria bacterium]|nr:MFS transporter [Candidatus Kaiserbacteria bacterium]